MKKALFHFGMPVGILILVAVFFTGCSSDNNNNASVYKRTQERMLPTPTQAPTPKQRIPSTAEVAKAKAQKVEDLKLKWRDMLNPNWVEQMKKRNDDACSLGGRYNNIQSFGSYMNFDVSGRDITFETHQISFEDIGLTEVQYRAALKAAGVTYLKALVSAYKTNSPPRCEGGEGAILAENKFRIVEEISNTLEWSKDNNNGKFLLMPSDIGLTKESLRDMARSAAKEEAAKKKPKRDLLYDALRDWNFKPEEIGMTKVQAEELIGKR